MCCSLRQPQGPLGTQGPPGLEGSPQGDAALSPGSTGSACPQCLLLGKPQSLRARASTCASAPGAEEGVAFPQNIEGLGF